MTKTKFIFQIETEPHFNILIKVLSRFARQRVVIEELQTVQQNEIPHRISITISETKDKSIQLSKKIEGV